MEALIHQLHGRDPLLETGRGNPGLAPVLEALQALDLDLDLDLMTVDRADTADGPADLDRLLARTRATFAPEGPSGG